MTTKKNIIDFITAEKDTFCDGFGIKSLVLYGSYAQQNQKTGSDIDFMYEMKDGKAMTLRKLKRLETIIKEMLNVDKVELVNKKYMNPVVYANAEQYAISIF